MHVAERSYVPGWAMRFLQLVMAPAGARHALQCAALVWLACAVWQDVRCGAPLLAAAPTSAAQEWRAPLWEGGGRPPTPAPPYGSCSAVPCL
jgi:hypothetical protein